jgi:four helix bundle protein
VATEINSYRDLRVRQLAMDAAEGAYRLTTPFPPIEMYGMTTQVRRAAVSIAANIAEGYGRESSGSFVNSLRMAQGSLKELETHLLLAVRVGLVTDGREADMLGACDELGRMLRPLIRSIERSEHA